MGVALVGVGVVCVAHVVVDGGALLLERFDDRAQGEYFGFVVGEHIVFRFLVCVRRVRWL